MIYLDTYMYVKFQRNVGEYTVRPTDGSWVSRVKEPVWKGSLIGIVHAAGYRITGWVGHVVPLGFFRLADITPLED